MSTGAQPRALPDQADRDVVRGRHGTDTTVFVDAGAGTGKTTALVDRIVTLVVAGVPVTRIAAITFTEAAAAELRHRVRTALERRAGEVRDSADDEVALRRVTTALEDLDQARFSTLHAFAHRILSDHPIEAGLAPDFELLGEIDEAAAFDLEWEAWLSSFVNEGSIQPALAQMDLVGLTIQRVRTLAEALHRDVHRIPADLPERPVRYDPPDVDLSDVLACVRDVEVLVDHGRAAGPDDALLPLLDEWVRRGRALAEVAVPGADRGQVFTAVQHVIDAPSLGNRGTKAAWGELGGGKPVRDRAKLLPAACADVLASQADHLLRALAGWAAHFVTSWAGRRRRTATLVFQDLLVLTRDLLRDHQDVRGRVADGLDHLLVDEFQDTDPVQIEVAVLLAARDPAAVAASADASGAVDWTGAQLVPGRLFFVGDPKQSIYRFRGADIAVYEGAKDVVVGDGGDLRHLSHNFRSVPGVVDWVNTVFDDLLEPQRHAQPTYRPLTTQRASLAVPANDPAPDQTPDDEPTASRHGSPAVRWFGGASDDAAQDTRRIEAGDVVDVVQGLVGRELVHDGDLDQVRPARHGDIAVLVRRHATARQLERSFDDAGLPLVVEARSLVFGTDEVRDLVNLLTAIEDPNDGVAVVASLRHASLGCSDADLLAWQVAGGRWQVPDDPDEDLLDGLGPDRGTTVGEGHPVVRGLRTLAALRAGRAERTVGGIVEDVVDRLHLREVVLAQPRPRDRWRRIGFVVDQAHAYHAGGGHLRGFVRWMRQQEEEGVRAHEHVVSDPDDDAVRVTTVHAAKGLEYPIVIVLGLDTGTDRAPHDPRLLWAPGGSPELNLGTDLKTADYARLLRGDDDVVGARRHHQHEEARLLYVATTRARDLLVVSLHHSSRRCHAAWLLERVDLLGDRWARQDTAIAPLAAAPDDDPGPPVTAAEVEAFRRRHDEVTAAAGRPRILAATTIAELVGDDPGARARPATHTPPDRQLALELESQRPRTSRADDPGAPRPTPTPRRVDAPADDVRPDDADDTQERPGTWRRGRAGSAIGRAVHAVLQSVDLRTLDDLSALARSQCAIEGLPLGDAELVADRVRRAAGTPIVAAALDGLQAGGRIWRELHVGSPLAGGEATSDVAVEGFVDLLVEFPPAAGSPGPGDLVVVDWKTDAASGRDPAEVVARYRPQAATYALALEATLGRPVDRCVFVLTGVADPDRRQVELAGDELRRAVGGLRAALADRA